MHDIIPKGTHGRYIRSLGKFLHLPFIPQNHLFIYFYLFLTSYASSTITHKFIHAFASLLS